MIKRHLRHAMKIKKIVCKAKIRTSHQGEEYGGPLTFALQTKCALRARYLRDDVTYRGSTLATIQIFVTGV